MTKNQLRVGPGFSPALASDSGPDNLMVSRPIPVFMLTDPLDPYSPLWLDAQVETLVLCQKNPELITLEQGHSSNKNS